MILLPKKDLWLPRDWKRPWNSPPEFFACNCPSSSSSSSSGSSRSSESSSSSSSSSSRSSSSSSSRSLTSTACCPSNGLPDQLVATFSNSGTCPDFDNQILVLNKRSANCWQNDQNDGGNNVAVWFGCFGANCQGFAISLQQGAGN